MKTWEQRDDTPGLFRRKGFGKTDVRANASCDVHSVQLENNAPKPFLKIDIEHLTDKGKDKIFELQGLAGTNGIKKVKFVPNIYLDIIFDDVNLGLPVCIDWLIQVDPSVAKIAYFLTKDLPITADDPLWYLKKLSVEQATECAIKYDKHVDYPILEQLFAYYLEKWKQTTSSDINIRELFTLASGIFNQRRESTKNIVQDRPLGVQLLEELSLEAAIDSCLKFADLKHDNKNKPKRRPSPKELLQLVRSVRISDLKTAFSKYSYLRVLIELPVDNALKLVEKHKVKDRFAASLFGVRQVVEEGIDIAEQLLNYYIVKGKHQDPAILKQLLEFAKEAPIFGKNIEDIKVQLLLELPVDKAIKLVLEDRVFIPYEVLLNAYLDKVDQQENFVNPKLLLPLLHAIDIPKSDNEVQIC